MRVLAALLAAVLPALAQPPADLNFLSNHVDGRELRDSLPRYAKSRAFRLLDQRRERVRGFATAHHLDRYRQQYREKMIRLLGGPFPNKTPLNARTTATLDYPDYRIEKIVFESQPGFPVTANLYLPRRGRAPHPAILFPLGHEAGAKAHEAWQYALVSFARKGYVCLAWDPIGQGERIQLWDDDFQESKVVRSTTEHTIVGLQTLLVGDPLARYTIWDGIRALDYLLSRPEVDPARVGVTGNSGGGTHTAYLASLEDRFAAAAPSCYLTSWRRLLETIGPQDAEQCIPGWLAEGLDHADFVLSFAPKPYLMLVAIRDFFSLAGARDTYQEAARVYDSLGAGARFGKFEADDGHGYTQPRRLAAYRFFGQHLLGAEDTEGEPLVTILREEELWATATGQVSTALPQAETVHSLNLKRLNQLRGQTASLDALRKLLQFSPDPNVPVSRSYGSLDRDGYRIEKLTLEAEAGITLPALLYLPNGSGKRPAIVLAHGQGKAAAHPWAEALTRRGEIVLSLDLRGLGETRAVSERNGSDWARFFGDYESAMTAMLTGKPLVAMRAEDVSRSLEWLRARPEVDPTDLMAYGIDQAAIPVLFAAALDARVRKVTLERMLISYEAVVRHRLHRLQWENAIPGVLRHFDLPDIVRLLAPRPVRLVDVLNPLGQPAALPEVRRSYPSVPARWRQPGAPLLDVLH
jgi:cephalosporin-C deacetylase-like acetyl esterase